MRIVLDTNVWVSALISPAGTPAALMRKLEDHVLITSEEMLEEVQRVLQYERIAERYNVTPGMAKEYLDNIKRKCGACCRKPARYSNCRSRSRPTTCFLYAPQKEGRTVSFLVTATCYASLSIKASQLCPRRHYWHLSILIRPKKTNPSKGTETALSHS